MKLIINRIVSEFNKIFNGTKRVGDSLKLEGKRMSALDVANASTLGYKSESSLSVKSAVTSDKTISIQSFNTLGNPNTDSNGNPVYVKEHQLRVANAQKLNDVSAINLEVDISRRLKVGDQVDSPIINVSSLIVNPTLFRVKDSSLLGGKAETDLYVAQAKLADNATLLNNKAASALSVEKSRIATKLYADDGTTELTESGLRVSSAQYIRKGTENLDIYGIRDYLFATDQAKAVVVTTSSSTNTLTTASGNKSFTDILTYLKTDTTAEIYKASHLITGSGASISVKTGDEVKTWIIDHADFATKVGTLNANTSGRAVRLGDATGTTYNITELLAKIPTIKVDNSTLSDNSTKLQNNTPDDIIATARTRILTDASNTTTGLTQGEVDGFFGNTKIQSKVKSIKVDSAINSDTVGTKTVANIMQDVKDAGQVLSAKYIYSDPSIGGQKSYLDITADITAAKSSLIGTATTAGNTLGKLETIIGTNKTNIENALSTEVTTRASQDTTLQNNINTEKGRIDAILFGADDDKNTFAEIKTYILSLTGDLTTKTTPLANGVSLNLVNISNALETRIANVESNASTATGNVGSEVDKIENAVGLKTNGDFPSSWSGYNYINSATTVIGIGTLLDTALKSEESSRISGDSTLLGKIGTLTSLTTTAKTDLVSSINEVKSSLGSETTRATGVEGTLTSLTTTAKSNLVAAINEVSSAITSETTRATGVEGTLSSLTTTAKNNLVAAINEVKSSLGSETTTRSTNEGVIADLTTTNKTNLVLAINSVKSDLGSETSRATGVEGTLTSLTTTAKSNLVAAINEVKSSLGTETSRATGVEGTLTSLTTTAKSNLVAAINEVSSALTSEISTRTSNDTTLQTNINNISNSMGWTLNANGKINITNTNYLNITDGTVLDIFKQSDTQMKSNFNNLDIRVNTLVTDINTEKGRIDSILSASTADKDSFKEIVDLINSVDTTNDTAFAGYVLSNDVRSTTIESDLTNEITRATTQENTLQSNIDAYISSNDTRSTNIEKNISDEITRATSQENTLQSNIDAYISSNNTRSTTIESRVANLEGLNIVYNNIIILIEDDGTGNSFSSYTIFNKILDNTNSIIFSNGIKMRKNVHYTLSNDGVDTLLTINMLDKFPVGEFIDIETISLG